MREFKVHYTINEVEDYFTLIGKDMSEIRAITEQEMQKRKLDESKNNLWSEEIKC